MKGRAMVTACAVVLVCAGAHSPAASDGFESLVKLAQSGLDEKAFREAAATLPYTYDLTVDEILFLSDLGLSAEAIKAIPSRGRLGGHEAGAAGEALAGRIDVLLDDDGGGPGDAGGTGEAPAADAGEARDVVSGTVTAPPVIGAPAPDMASFVTFYEALAPYGRWLDLDGVWCWQPTAVRIDAAWSPYCQRGRWIYTDWGWLWQSSYSWGWAPFHYGRWRHHARYRWVWVPDRVWGPAWVCWRYSDEVIGWAPLPPEATWEDGLGLCYLGRAVSADVDFGLSWVVYTFVPLADLCDIRVAHHRFPASRASTVFRSVPTWQHRFIRQEGRICNVGPPPERVGAAAHREIRPATVVAEVPSPGGLIPRSRLSGSVVAVYRPEIAPVARENPRQVVARREWTDRERWRVMEGGVRGQDLPAAPAARDMTRSPVTPGTVAPPDLRRRESDRATEAARQRLDEETAARLQAEQKRRAEDLERVRKIEAPGVTENARTAAGTESRRGGDGTAGSLDRMGSVDPSHDTEARREAASVGARSREDRFPTRDGAPASRPEQASSSQAAGPAVVESGTRAAGPARGADERSGGSAGAGR